MRLLHAWIFASLLLGLLALPACETALERVDREAFEAIAARQADALGSQVISPDVVPPPPVDPEPTARSYERNPDTRNPLAENLPAERAVDQPDPLSGVPDMMIADPADPDAISLDLADVLAFAVRHSRVYRTQQENLYLTALNLLVEQHLWGPRFFQTVAAQFDGNLDTTDRDDALRLINEMGVRQRLPYGGEIAATALVQYVDLLSGSASGEGHAELVGLSITLPLLRGAGKVAQEDLIQAQRNLVYAARDFERFRREFLLDIASTYYDLLRAQAEIENLQGQVENLQWLLRRIEALAEAGREPYFEVQRSEQQVLFARNNLLNRREAYAQLLDSFKITLNMPLRQAVLIEPSEVVIAEPVLDEERSVATALENRLDLQTDLDQIEDARRQVAVAKNLTLPGLDLSASASARTETNQGVALDRPASDYSASITFDAPWDREIETIAWRRALVRLEQFQREFTLARDTVVRQVRSSIRRIIQARAALALQNRNIDIARTRLRGVLLRLRSLGPRDFIEAQEDLTEARNRRDAALRDLRVSILQYLLDTGQMRVRVDGQWDPPAGLIVPPGEEPMPEARDMLDPLPEDVPMMDAPALDAD